jgi:cytoskeletal protein CcmA (bactofilin family)
MNESSTTVLGQTTSIVGELHSDDDIRVEGTVDGNILTSRDLIIGPNAEVKGDLQGRVVRVEGRVTGNVRATGVLEIGSNGQLVGDIVAAALRIDDGGGFRGQVAIEGGDDDGESATAAESGELEQVPTVSGLHIPAPSRSVLHSDLDDIPPAWDTEEHLAADTSAGLREVFDDPIRLESAIPQRREDPLEIDAYAGGFEDSFGDEPYQLRNPASILIGDSSDDLSGEFDDEIAPPKRSIDQLRINEEGPRPGLRPPPSNQRRR